MDRHISGKKDLPKRHTLKLSHFSERINVFKSSGSSRDWSWWKYLTWPRIITVANSAQGSHIFEAAYIIKNNRWNRPKVCEKVGNEGVIVPCFLSAWCGFLLPYTHRGWMHHLRYTTWFDVNRWSLWRDGQISCILSKMLTAFGTGSILLSS